MRDVTIRRIAEIVRGVPTLVDSTGVGDPIVEALEREGLLVAGFKFTSASKQTFSKGSRSRSSAGRSGTKTKGFAPSSRSSATNSGSGRGTCYSAPSGITTTA